MQTKICKTCQADKPVSEFYKAAPKKGGVPAWQTACKPCHNGRERSPDAAEKQRAQIRAWHETHRALLSDRAAERYRKNREQLIRKAKEYRERNIEKVTKLQKRWRDKNKGKVRSYRKDRRDLIERATPSWACDFAYEEACDLAVRREAATGIKWHVDHVVPLKSKLVCGLHAHTNFAVIPATENLKKKNSYWPCMP
jgi:hypothetical protein